MAKKTLKNEGSETEGRPSDGVGIPGATGADHVDDINYSSSARLFALFVARVATIDRYRVPITDKGLPAAYRKAFDEAKMALEVYNQDNERDQT